MKYNKAICFAVLLLAVFAILGAQVPRVSNWEDGINNAYLFAGFDFLNYTPSTNGLEYVIKKEYEEIKNGSGDVTKPTGPYAIVGYSQGGLRALGYAGWLKKTYPTTDYKNLQGVITISGVDKGIKAMNGGLGVLVSNFKSIVNTTWGGFRSAATALTVFNIPGLFIPKDSDGTVNLLLTLLPFFVDGIPSYVKPAYIDPSSKSLQELHDMAPGSKFVTDYVATSKQHTYQRQTGTQTALEWRYAGGWFPYLVTVSKPIYTTYTAYEDIPKIDPNLPVGYIVGLDSNTLGMMPDGGKEARKITDGLGSAFLAAEITHVVKCVGIVGLLTGSVEYAQSAAKAKDMMWNIDRTLNNLKGSPSNDGLVAEESQYYPSSFLDPNTNQTRMFHNKVLGFHRMPKNNHQNIYESSNGTRNAETLGYVRSMILNMRQGK
ncbi:MAG: hypothetical protein LBV43_08040 [Prevotella sp.]|jgi:hypothetical protein|nr:hypothetical protein [Prevotella sp.]